MSLLKLFFAIFTLVVKSTNINCNSQDCIICNIGYSYRNISCLSFCPSGFNQLEDKKTCLESSLTVFNLNFKSYFNITSSTIEGFSHPLGLAFDSMYQQSPIPTKERGFFFSFNSGLLSKNPYIPAPDFNISLFIRILSNGTIFELQKISSSMIKIEDNNDLLMASLLIMNSSYSYTENIQASSNKLWKMISLATKQTKNSIDINLNNVKKTISLFEFQWNSTNITSIIGSLTGHSFSGFIYEINFRNTNNYIYKASQILSLCEKHQYIASDNTCQNCNSDCSNWTGCISSQNCSICYSYLCTRCSGFGPENCGQCSDPSLNYCMYGKNCQIGSGFICSQCISSYNLVNNICINPPSNFSVLDLKFDIFEKFYGGYFQSGISPSTYAPYNDPSADDPFPVKYRGMYFQKGAFLHSPNLTLSHSFMVMIWLKDFYAHQVFISPFLNISSNGSAQVVLSNSISNKMFSLVQLILSNEWIFYGIMVEYENATSSLALICNGKRDLMISVEAFAFYGGIGNFNISDKKNEFYLFELTIYHDLSLNWLFRYSNCIGQITCIWNSSYSLYYSSFEKISVDCDSSCSNGCSMSGTCNSCSDILCPKCDGFFLTCNASQSTNPCNGDLHLNPLKTQCCSLKCFDCYGKEFFKCYSCAEGYKQLDYICTEKCPTGFITTQDNKCLVKTEKYIAKVTFEKIADSFQDEYGNTYITGNDSNFYPNFSFNDPIPAESRGFYFKNVSLIRMSEILLPYNFSLIFWLRQISSGILINKDTLKINSNGKIVFNDKILKHSDMLSLDQWTQYIIAFTCGLSGLNIVTFKNDDKMSFAAYNGQNMIFQDVSSQMIIGSGDSGFVGFIWKFLIYLDTVSGSSNFFSSPSPQFIHVNCTFNTTSTCLGICSFNYYMESGKCHPCSGCSTGCVRSSDCNLCKDQKCLLCSTFDSICTECIPNSSLNSNKCECNSGFYWNSIKFTCEACPEGCQSCISFISCSYCKGNMTLINGLCKCKVNEYMKDNNCFCVSGFYLNNGICELCNFPCASCDSANFCLTCKDSFKLAVNNSCICGLNYFRSSEKCEYCDPLLHKFVNGSSCGCYQGYYLDSTICQKCESHCKDCFEYSKCLSCNGNLTLIDSNCSCPQDFYEINNYCYSNEINCEKMSFSGSCLKCKGNLTLTSSCGCESGFYQFGIFCLPCFEKCKSCSGGLENNCLTCQNNMNLTNGSCECGRFFVENQMNCVPCSENCKDCTGSFDDCTDCNENMKLSGGKCECIEGYFQKEQKCLPCFEKCKSCSGGLENNCLTCQNNMNLTNGSCECGKFLIENQMNCVPCSENCKDCTGSFDNCTDCNENMKLSGGKCECIEGFFKKEKKCLPCFEKCKSCIGGLENNCLTCQNNMNLTNGSCTCGRFFIENQMNCVPCSENCKDCTGSFDNCTDCNENMKLSGGKCECIKGYFQKEQKCLPCFENCDECNGPDVNQCNSCIGNLSFYNGECLCDKGFYQNYENCFPCFERCETCLQGTENECSSCRGNLSLLMGSCSCNTGFEEQDFYCIPTNNSTKDICPDGQFLDKGSNLCKNCSFLCLACQDNRKCSKCNKLSKLNESFECECLEGYKLKNQECIKEYFYCKFQVNNSSGFKLIFSEALENDLLMTDVNLLVNLNESNFLMSKISNKSYEFKLNLKIGNSLIFFYFLKEIRSSNKKFLQNNNFSFSIINKEKSKNNILLSKLEKHKLEVSISATVSISLLSILLRQPSYFFNFLNFIELFYYIILYDIDLDPSFISFLKSMKSSCKVPNVFSSKIHLPNEKLPEKFLLFEINSSICLLNLLTSIIILFFLLCLIPFNEILKRLKKNAIFDKIVDFLDNYLKYNAFLRFYLQVIFDAAIFSFLSLKYSKYEENYEIVDKIWSIFLITCLLCTLVLLYWAVIRNTGSFNNEQLLSFFKKYGTILDEFQHQRSKRLYYFIYILRRVAISFSLIFSSSIFFQLGISILTNLTVIIYLLMTKPYKNTLDLIYEISNEILLFTYYITLLISEAYSIEINRTSKCYYSSIIILTTLLFCIIFRITVFLYQIFMKIFKNLHHTKVHPIQNIQEINPKDLKSSEIQTSQPLVIR